MAAERTGRIRRFLRYTRQGGVIYAALFLYFAGAALTSASGHDFIPMQTIGTSAGADFRSEGSHDAGCLIGIPAALNVSTNKSRTGLGSLSGSLTTQTILPQPRTLASRLYTPTKMPAASSALAICTMNASASPSTSAARLMAGTFPFRDCNTSDCAF